MTYETLIVDAEAGFQVIRLNRPQALNALNTAMMAELTAALDAAEADPEVRCVVLTGSDKAFAAGADIKEMADKTFIEAYLGNFCADWDRAARTRKPVVAAVAGFALGVLLLAKLFIREVKGFPAPRWENFSARSGTNLRHRRSLTRWLTHALAGLTLAVLAFCVISVLNARSDSLTWPTSARA